MNINIEYLNIETLRGKFLGENRLEEDSRCGQVVGHGLRRYRVHEDSETRFSSPEDTCVKNLAEHVYKIQMFLKDPMYTHRTIS